MGNKKRKILEMISKMPRKDRDIAPTTDAVKSAVVYMQALETFFETKSHGKIAVYPLLAQTLKGIQKDDQPAAISGRLFFDLSCFIRKNETSGIMQRELQEISAKEKVNGKAVYHFESKEVVSAIEKLIKSKDIKQVDPILQSIVENIQNSPAWITFWRDRIGVVGIDEDLQIRVLQSLVYKIAGDCHQAYLAKHKPSLDEQKSALRLINAFKLGALKVSPVLPAILTKPSHAASSQPSESEAVTPRKRANAFVQPRPPEVALAPPTPTVKTTAGSKGKVKSMAEDYQRSIDNIKAEIEQRPTKGTTSKKR